MKRLVLLFSICIHQLSIVHAQSYAYTGKVSSVNLSLESISSMHSKGSLLHFNTVSSSISMAKMISRGIYPTVGYTCTRAYKNIYSNPREENVKSESSFKNGHSLNASFLVQKHLMVTQNRRISTGCFHQTLSLIFAPEYNYMLPNNQRTNLSKGEVALKMGLCLFNVHSGTVSRNIIWDFYYRKGFTPIISYNDQYGKQSFYKDEIGVQLRILFRQRYDFSGR